MCVVDEGLKFSGLQVSPSEGLSKTRKKWEKKKEEEEEVKERGMGWWGVCVGGGYFGDGD